MIHRNKAKKWGLEDDLKEHAERYAEILEVDLKDKSRIADKVEKRQVIMWKLLKSGYTTVEIGRYVGISHASVIHNSRKIDDLLSIGDPIIKRLTQLI